MHKVDLESPAESIAVSSINDNDGVVDEETGLKRTLKSRHLAMISIGGVIGQGLFLSSGANLGRAGPAGLLIAYAIVSIVVFFVALQLGEMSAYISISGAHTVYCRRFVHKSFGNCVGFIYFSIPLVMRYWTDAIPDYAWSIIFLILIFIINLFGAKGWGEAEYWFSLVKILLVLVFLIVGCLTAGGVIGGEVYGFKYWSNPGAFADGVLGVINALVLAALTMTGVDIVGVSAGESENPAVAIPKAVKNVFYRIVFIYMFTVLVMGLVIPYNDPHNFASGSKDVSMSPFTLVFEKAGLHQASHVVNAAILITLISCGNSSLFVTARTLVALSKEGVLPKKLGYTTKNGVPIYALICASVVGIICFVTSFVPGDVLFLVLCDIGGITGLLTWLAIAVAQLRFRKAFIIQGHDLKELPYVAPWFPYTNYIVVVGCIVIILLSGWKYFVPPSAQGLIGSYGAPILFILGIIFHKYWSGSKMVKLEEADITTGAKKWNPDDIQKPSSKGKSIFKKILNFII